MKLIKPLLPQLCRHAADNIMKLLSTWRTLYKLRYCPVTLIQTAFSAGTVYLLTAMQPNSGTRISLEELRQLLDQETLVQQYLQEIGLSWNCATNDSDFLRKLMNEQVGPLLEFLDRTSIPKAIGDSYISADIDADDEEERGLSLPCLSLPDWPDVAGFEILFRNARQLNPHRTISSLSTPPKYTLTSSTQVPPSRANALSTHAVRSGPIAIRSEQFMSDPASFASPWSLLSSEDASGGQRSFLAHNIQPRSATSSRNHYVGGHLGMLSG